MVFASVKIATYSVSGLYKYTINNNFLMNTWAISSNCIVYLQPKVIPFHAK